MSIPQATIPAFQSQASGEDLTYSFNTQPYLAPGETLGTATAVLTDNDGNTVTLQDVPTISGAQVYQRVRDILTPASAPYRLTLTVTISASTNVYTPVLQLTCPF